MLTAGDVRMVVYFHQEKGDMTRYSGWDDIKEELFQRQPRLRAAIEQLALAEDQLNNQLDKLTDLEIKLEDEEVR